MADSPPQPGTASPREAQGAAFPWMVESYCPKGTATPSRVRPGSVGALVIKQCFRTCDFPRRCTRLVGQKIETGPAATERRSDHNQCLASHGKLARRKTAGEQLERIHVGQAIRLDLHRRKSVPEKWRAKKRPGSVNFRLVAAQELSDLRGDAGNMNMELVLAAASCRINRHSDLVARQLTARPFLDETAGVTGCLPIVWRIFPQQRRAFDAGNTSGRDNDNMRSARRRPEHGKASLETIGYADLGTRKPHADALVGWYTDVVDDDPQPTPVGGRGRLRQIRESGEDQPHGSRETSDFAQDEPFRNAAHCRIKAGPVPIVKNILNRRCSGEERVRQSMAANNNPTTEVLAGLVERVTFSAFCA